MDSIGPINSKILERTDFKCCGYPESRFIQHHHLITEHEINTPSKPESNQLCAFYAFSL